MFSGRRFAKSTLLGDSGAFSANASQESTQDTSDDANLVISASSADYVSGPHYPVIDIDVPVNLLPASRLGHTHLYLNVAMSQAQMFKLLDVMCEVGLVEAGFVSSAKKRGYSAVRLPWIKKDVDQYS